METKSEGRAGWRHASIVSACLLAVWATPITAQTVTNVRARQLTDGTKKVEVLYNLAGAADAGATVALAFSKNGAIPYDVLATAGVSGDVGNNVSNGNDKRILWDAAAALAVGTYGTAWQAAVTASNPSTEGREITVMLEGGVALELVRIPAGTFQMGSPATERSRGSDETLHQVTITSDYYMGKYEVTEAQWVAVVTGYGDRNSFPVVGPSWDSVAGPGGFVEKLNAYLATTGQPGAGKFRLPTEAEWERAARGGSQTRFSFGDALNGDDSCGANAQADAYVWWCGNGGSYRHVIGSKLANQYGLFDMHGNVGEWCQDWDGPYSSSAQTNPTGPSSGTYRVVRGAGWQDFYLIYTRSAARSASAPNRGPSSFGFRIARSL